MHKENILFQLIKGLTKTEKRFFRLYSTLYHNKQNSNYMILFDILDGMNEFDKKVLQKKISENKLPSKALGALKVYLKKHILESLQLFYRNKHGTIKKFTLLNQALILKQKKHYNEAEKLLYNLKKRLEPKEALNISIYINNLLKTLEECKNNRSVDTFKRKDIYYDNMLRQTELLHELISIEKLHNQVRQIIFSPTGIEENQTKVLQDFFHQNIASIKYDELKGNRAKYYYLHICEIICSYSKPEIVNKIDTIEKVTILERMRKLLLENPQTFEKQDAFITISNLAGCYITMKKKEEFDTCIKDMDAILSEKTKKPRHQLLYWKYIRLCEFYTHIEGEQMPEIIIEEIQNHLKTVTIKEYNVGIIYKLARYFFTKKEYEQSKLILDDIFLVENVKSNDFYFFPIRIMYSLSLYELKEYNFAEKELLSLKRKMRREETNIAIIEKLFNILIKIIKTPIEEEKKCEIYLNELLNILFCNKNNIFMEKKTFLIYQWAKQKVTHYENKK